LDGKSYTLELSLVELEDFASILARISKGVFDKEKGLSSLNIGLSGPLGSGKTTFSSFFIKALGYPEIVTSPSYAICNEYEFTDETAKQVIVRHCDIYRISQAADQITNSSFDYNEIFDLSTDTLSGIYNCRYNVIEWFDMVSDPNFIFDINLNFSYLSISKSQDAIIEERKIEISVITELGKKLLDHILIGFSKINT
jgi:tRNA threonylcarbamoyl adenosine modification protein YjeE